MDNSSKINLDWRVFGHTRQKGFFESTLSHGPLSHAYIFSGPSNIGKTSLALDLAKILLCNSRENRPCTVCASCRLPLPSSPDFVCLDQLGEIKIEQIRQIKQKMVFKSSFAKHKIALISNAENMNTQAANALLKFLEEPDQHTKIMLTTSRFANLPLTIGSRAHKIIFSKAGQQDVQRFLDSYKVPAKTAQQLISLCDGKIGLIKSCLDSNDFFENLKNIHSNFRIISHAGLVARLKLSSALSALETNALVDMLNHWLRFADTKLSGESMKNTESFATLATAIQEAIEALGYNLNKKLVLDNLAINF